MHALARPIASLLLQLQMYQPLYPSIVRNPSAAARAIARVEGELFHILIAVQGVLLHPLRDVVRAPNLEHTQVPCGGVGGCEAETVDIDVASSQWVQIPS